LKSYQKALTEKVYFSKYVQSILIDYEDIHFSLT
jgi:hypothetical protein